MQVLQCLKEARCDCGQSLTFDSCLSFYICNPNHEFTACPWKILQQQIGPKELARPKIVRAWEQGSVTLPRTGLPGSHPGSRPPTGARGHGCPVFAHPKIPRLAVGDQCSGCRAEVEVLVVPSCQNSLERQNMSLCYSLWNPRPGVLGNGMLKYDGKGFIPKCQNVTNLDREFVTCSRIHTDKMMFQFTV